MDTQELAKEYRLSKWAQIIQARKESGKSVKNFCEDTGISKNTYFYWQRKLREAACKDLMGADESKELVPDGWVRLEPVKLQNADEGISIEINGCHVIVKSNTDLQLLKNICVMLRSL